MRDSSGFSVIELLIVAAILAILLGVGFVRFDPSRWELSQAEQVLSQEISRARFEAIKSNRMVELQFDLTGEGAYSLCVDENSDQVCEAAEVISTTTFGSGDFPRTRIAGTDLPNNRIRFDLRGIPTESLFGTSIDLETESGSATSKLVLSATGRVEIQ
ncbi:MAG TPA: GspH/FimT family pseudopilin [Trueperaceae bacterium]